MVEMMRPGLVEMDSVTGTFARGNGKGNFMRLALTAFMLATGLLVCGSTDAEPAAGTIWTEPRTGMEFVWIPPGCFNMGSEEGDKDEQPVHKVCLQGFWMGRYEVMQAQYQQVMGKEPSYFWSSNKPVERVSWEYAKMFAEEMGRSTGARISLPTEAQWEYACRAGGAHGTYCGGGSPGRLAWHDANSDKQTHPVGQLGANEWGLYDMSGNVWEWTQDCYNDSYKGAPADGSAWGSGDCGRHVVRGGSGFLGTSFLRAANRFNFVSGNRGFSNGFRVTRTLP